MTCGSLVIDKHMYASIADNSPCTDCLLHWREEWPTLVPESFTTDSQRSEITTMKKIFKRG